MAPNLLPHSKKPPQKVKMQGLLPFEAGSGEKDWLFDGDRSDQIFLSLIFFHLVIARQPSAPLAERMTEDKEIGCSVGFMQNCSRGFTFARILWDFR